MFCTNMSCYPAGDSAQKPVRVQPVSFMLFNMPCADVSPPAMKGGLTC